MNYLIQSFIMVWVSLLDLIQNRIQFIDGSIINLLNRYAPCLSQKIWLQGHPPKKHLTFLRFHKKD